MAMLKFLTFCLVVTAFARAEEYKLPNVSIPAPDALDAVRSDILRSRGSLPDLVAWDAMDRYVENAERSKRPLDLDNTIKQFNAIRHAANIKALEAGSPDGYKIERVHLNALKSLGQLADATGQLGALGSATTLNLPGAVGGVSVSVLAKTGVALTDATSNVLNLYEIYEGPNKQVQTQRYLASFETQAEQITARIAKRGRTNPAFALAWKLSGSARDTKVDFSTDAIQTIEHNQDLFMARDLASMNEKTSEILDLMQRSFDENGKLNLPTQALFDQMKSMSAVMAKEIAGELAQLEKANAEKQLQKTRDFRAVASCFQLGSTLIGLGDKKAGYVIGTLGQSTLSVWKGISDFKAISGKKGGEFASLDLVSTLATAVTSLFSAILGGGPDINELILEEVRALRVQVEKLREHMTARFDQVDRKLNQIFDEMLVGFRSLDTKIENIREGIEIVKGNLVNIERLMMVSDLVTSNRLLDGFYLQVEADIKQCLDIPPDAITQEFFLSCLSRFAFYATTAAANKVVTIDLPLEATSRAVRNNLPAFYQTIDAGLSSKLWENINFISDINSTRFRSRLPRLNELPQVNPHYFVRYSIQMSRFIQKHESRALTNAKRSQMGQATPLSLLNDVLDRGIALQTGLAELAVNFQFSEALRDYRALLESASLEAETLIQRQSTKMGGLDISAPIEKQPSLAITRDFLDKNKLAAGDELKHFASFAELHPCSGVKLPYAAPGTKPPVLPMPEFVLSYLTNEVKTAVLLEMGSVEVCYRDAGFDYSRAVKVLVRDTRFGLPRLVVQLTFKDRNGGEIVLSRRKLVASKDREVNYETTLYTTKHGHTAAESVSEDLSDRDKVHYTEYNPGAEPGKSVAGIFVEKWWNADMAGLKGKNTATEGIELLEEENTKDEHHKLLADFRTHVADALKSRKNDAKHALEEAIEKSGAPLGEKIRAATGSARFIQSVVRLTLPETLESNDGFHKMVVGSNGLMDVDELLTELRKPELNPFELVEDPTPGKRDEKPKQIPKFITRFNQAINNVDELIKVFDARAQHPLVKLAGRETHIPLEGALICLRTTKSSLEMQTPKRPISDSFASLRAQLRDFQRMNP